MTITLPQKLEDQIQEKVTSGAYASAADVVQASLRLLEEHDAKHTELRAAIQEGIAELDRGEGIPFDSEALIAEFRQEYRSQASEK